MIWTKLKIIKRVSVLLIFLLNFIHFNVNADERIQAAIEQINIISKDLKTLEKAVYKSSDAISLSGSNQNINEDIMAKHFAKFDIVATSSMTPYAEINRSLFTKIKKLNPNVYLIWGGIHPIVDSEDAIKYADAICTGEGEFAFRDFLKDFKAGNDFTKTGNFWFRKNGEVVRNGFLPLQHQNDMDGLPLPLYADNELIFKKDKGFIPLQGREYRRLNGIGYHTVWSIGCPFKCSYCSNSKFIDNDEGLLF